MIFADNASGIWSKPNWRAVTQQAPKTYVCMCAESTATTTVMSTKLALSSTLSNIMHMQVTIDREIVEILKFPL